MATPDDLASTGEAATAGPVPPDLGPFDPPDDYPLEDELLGDPPRPLTPELRLGRHAVRQRKAVSGLLLAAALCTAAGLLPIVQTWGLYFLPLQYITWIGTGCGIWAMCVFIADRYRLGPYRYVKRGIPLPVRIRALELRPTVLHHGQPTRYRFFAAIEYRDPETGDLRVAVTPSNEFAVWAKGRLTTTYRVGDYTTAVYLPGKFERSLRLYGFLELKPDLGLVRRDAARERGVLHTGLVLLALFGFFAMLGWSLYAFGKFPPLDLSVRQGAPPFAAGAVVFGGGLLAVIVFVRRRDRAQRAERNAQAAARGEAVEWEPAAKPGWFGVQNLLLGLIIVAGAIVIGGLIGLICSSTVNALLDTSPPKYRPTQLERRVSVTHDLLFREYKIEYHFLDGDPKKREILSTPAEMAQFTTDLALAEVHSGRLGWPWVKRLIPVGLGPDPVPRGAGAR
jgi:hypothetical protein